MAFVRVLRPITLHDTPRAIGDVVEVGCANTVRNICADGRAEIAAETEAPDKPHADTREKSPKLRTR